MKKALWITCGIKGNAGDALLYQVTEALFSGRIDLDFRYVSEAVYLRPWHRAPKNVVIGPGGLFVQTNASRHLHGKLAKQWGTFKRRRFYLWSTGILQRPTEEEADAVRRVTSRSAEIIVRATKEIDFIKEVDPDTDPQWAPCASLFTDRLLGIAPRMRDVVVLNLDAFLFDEQNFAAHPLRRFKAYAESEGLEVRSMVNAAGDANRFSIDLFPLIDIDQPYFQTILENEYTGSAFNESFNDALSRHPSFGSRYTDCRFAFGKRLHGWLPFMAFDNPAAFVGMAARRGMPKDYFGSDDFLCDVPRKNPMSAAQLETMADRMIEKLSFFIANEDRLRAQIAARREELWQQLQEQAAAFADSLL